MSAALCCLTGDLRAQGSATKSPQIISLFRSVVAKSTKSTVRVLADGKDAALGIIITEDGWILSKYSVLKGKTIQCRLPDGKEVDAEMMGFDDPFDLVMPSSSINACQ